jgi:hypothetical protein
VATNPKTYQIKGNSIRETEKAVLISIISIDDEPQAEVKNYWMPKTQVVDMIFSDDPVELDTFTVKHWIMDQNGLV